MIGGFDLYLGVSLMAYLGWTVVVLLIALLLWLRTRYTKACVGTAVTMLLLVNLLSWHVGVRQQDLDRSAFNTQYEQNIGKIEAEMDNLQQAQKSYKEALEEAQKFTEQELDKNKQTQ